MRFEPTPGGPAGQGTASAPAYSEPSGSSSAQHPQGETEPSSGPSAGSTGRAAPNRGQHDRPDFGPTDDPRAEESDDSGGSSPAWLAGVLVVLLMALAVPMVVRVLARRRRWAAVTASPAVHRTRPAPPTPPTRRTPPGGDARRRPRPRPPLARQRLPRAAARRLGELLELDDESAGALGRIARAEELARYSRTAAPAPADSLRADVRTVREAFAASVAPAPAGAPACSPVHGRPDLGGRTIRGRPFHGGPHPPGRTGGPPPPPRPPQQPPLTRARGEAMWLRGLGP
ncbi:hypothetical protein ACFQHO_37380 [Actinomadura yumaensis]|uniref:hypothetical protein n=1 Tax=Actinomadura yumaensis TaxID=111807 RepID=UPI00360BC60E